MQRGPWEQIVIAPGQLFLIAAQIARDLSPGAERGPYLEQAWPPFLTMEHAPVGPVEKPQPPKVVVGEVILRRAFDEEAAMTSLGLRATGLQPRPGFGGG